MDHNGMWCLLYEVIQAIALLIKRFETAEMTTALITIHRRCAAGTNRQ
jgi:hypothetical protein